MTSRVCIKCTECGAIVTTRAALGHLDYQEFAYPCPKCKVEIRFGMELYPERHDWAYTKMKNGAVLREEVPGAPEMRFDSENLRSRLPWAKMMPFMETAFLAADFEKSRETFGHRFSAVHNGWPDLEKLLTHESTGNLALFNQALKQTGSDQRAKSKLEMAAFIWAALDNYGGAFSLDEGAARKRIIALITDARKHTVALTAALAYFETDDRIDQLWRQLMGIRAAWSRVFFIVAPVYWGLMWDPAKANLDDYELSQKRFEELKPFYIDCFETFCRLSVIAASLEGVSTLDQFVIPFPGDKKPVKQLEDMVNGNKHTILSQLKCGDLFVPFIDSKLRNGVGHNASHYDVTTDTIDYRNHAAKGIEDFSISHLRFCERVVRLYGQLEACAPLVHFLRSEGLAKSVR